MKELIFDQIRSHVTPFSQMKSITMNTDFARHTDLDSLKIMDMVMDLEDTFNVTLPINLLTEIKTVGDLVNIVYNRIQDIDTVMVQ